MIKRSIMGYDSRSEGYRCFIAVDVPDDLKNKIAELQEGIRGMDTKLVEKHNMHFTLKFLGEISGEIMDIVKDKLRELCSTKRFAVKLRGVGFFPTGDFIRVVWVGAESDEFRKLHEDVNTALSGIFRKERPVPHLTLARVRSQKYRKQLLAFAEENKGTVGEMGVDKISLKKSTLARKGPLYEDAEVFTLAG